MNKETAVFANYFALIILFLPAALVLRIFFFGGTISLPWLFDSVVVGTIAGLMAAMASRQLWGK